MAVSTVDARVTCDTKKEKLSQQTNTWRHAQVTRKSEGERRDDEAKVKAADSERTKSKPVPDGLFGAGRLPPSISFTPMTHVATSTWSTS